MHRAFQRRSLGTEAGIHHFAKRIPQGYDYAYGDSDSDSGTNLLITGPITITVIRTIGVVTPSPTSTTTSTTIPTTLSSYDQNHEAPPPGPLSTLLSTQSTPMSSSSIILSTSPGPSPPDGLQTGTANDIEAGNRIQPVGGATQPRAMSMGALVGVVVACILIFLGTLFFLVRRRYVRRRQRLRKEWTHSKGTQILNGSYEPKSASTTTAAPHIPNIPAQLPMSYGNEVAPASVIAAKRASSTTRTTYGPLSATSPLSQPMATVVSTFITTLPDELAITTGEGLCVLTEYDDGWALCLNARGEQGMVPMECLDGRFAISPDSMSISRGQGGNLRRVSSLQPTVGNVRRF